MNMNTGPSEAEKRRAEAQRKRQMEDSVGSLKSYIKGEKNHI